MGIQHSNQHRRTSTKVIKYNTIDVIISKIPFLIDSYFYSYVTQITIKHSNNSTEIKEIYEIIFSLNKNKNLKIDRRFSTFADVIDFISYYDSLEKLNELLIQF